MSAVYEIFLYCLNFLGYLINNPLFLLPLGSLVLFCLMSFVISSLVRR